ncbi:hypothetical protein AB0J38_01610 [Streptomyces sp. NPDC050095]|uniref:hypothetical protein n=1 Tax=unclassified Streptomyces TaxID=2593676 RepID=UPI00342EB388
MQHKRIAATLTAAALAVPVVAGTAWADPTPPTTPPAPVTTKPVPVDGGFVKLTLDAQLLARLKAKGIALAQLTTDCKVPKDAKGKPYLPPVASLSLGVKAGDIAAVDARLSGKVELAATCLGLVNVKAESGVVIKNLSADLSTGAIVGTLQDEKGLSEVKLGSFKRPALDKKTVDAAANSVTLDAAVELDAALAAKLNADLGVDLFVAGNPLLAVDSQLSLVNDVNLDLALGLNANVNASTSLDLGVILNGLLGLK